MTKWAECCAQNQEEFLLFFSLDLSLTLLVVFYFVLFFSFFIFADLGLGQVVVVKHDVLQG